LFSCEALTIQMTESWSSSHGIDGISMSKQAVNCSRLR
jgi:hypothetical protein